MTNFCPQNVYKEPDNQIKTWETFKNSFVSSICLYVCALMCHDPWVEVREQLVVMDSFFHNVHLIN